MSSDLLKEMYGGTDNLYKFMLICGMALLSLALIYPLQKRQVLEIEKNTFNKDVSVLNEEIKLLEKKIDQFYLTVPALEKAIDSLKQLPNFDKSIIDRKNEEYKSSVKKLRNERNDLKMKQIISKYQKQRIEIVDKHISSYDGYTKIMSISGIILCLIGLFKWWKRSKLQDKAMQN